MIRKGFEKVESFVTGISGFVLCVMTLWVFSDAVARYIFNHPLPGTLEITEEYFMVLTVFLAVSFTQKMKGHVRVDLFAQYFPQKILAVTDRIVTFIMILFAALLTRQSFAQALWCIKSHSTSRGSLGYPLAPAYMLMALGFFVLTLRLLFELFERKNGKEAAGK